MRFKFGNIKITRFLICILIAAFALISVRVSSIDFIGDNAHYALRSIGFVGMMFSDKQTTPLNWFNKFGGFAGYLV